jgi:hypothetical protein
MSRLVVSYVLVKFQSLYVFFEVCLKRFTLLVLILKRQTKPFQLHTPLFIYLFVLSVLYYAFIGIVFFFLNVTFADMLVTSRTHIFRKIVNEIASILGCYTILLGKNSFIHSLFCLTTGPKPPPKSFLHTVRSRASSFK